MEYVFPMIYRTIMMKLTWNNESIRENIVYFTINFRNESLHKYGIISGFFYVLLYFAIEEGKLVETGSCAFNELLENER